ncbi:hypothetical protein GA0070615_6410 [Micromonospora aurantiaca]|nr:hypothetical protein GA0070615_6410 [Micromonospora aurantiaca]
MRELADGVAFWRSRPKWPADFHNTDYQRWGQQNPNGNFTDLWWQPFLRTLQAWIATRPFSGEVLTSRFKEHATALGVAWQEACVKCLEGDISTVTWDEIKVFPNEVAKIKPTKAPSPVFTSKFCHFLLPKVFPVVDNEGLGNGWPTYEAYFRFVQEEWQSTGAATRAELVAELTRLIEATGQHVYPGFPMSNKITELRLIGRRHPT